MKIVLLDQWGCFAASVVAAYCTGVIKKKTNFQEILALPFFAVEGCSEPGELYYLGKDGQDNEYYTLGVGLYGNFIAAIAGPELLKMSEGKEDIRLYDLSCLNPRVLCFLEMVTRGRMRSLSKYLWAYYFAQKIHKMVAIVNQKIESRK